MVLPLRGDWGFPHDLGKQDNGQEPEEGVGVGKRTPIPINSTGVYVFRFFSIAASWGLELPFKDNQNCN